MPDLDHDAHGRPLLGLDVAGHLAGSAVLRAPRKTRTDYGL
jgi:hypothetical protein